MHYGNKQQLKHQKILITVYKDEWVDCDKTKLEDRKHCIQVESIIEARYVSTHSICQLHYNIEHILRDEIPKMENDIFHLVELKTDGYLWKVVKIKKLTNKMLDANPLLALH